MARWPAFHRGDELLGGFAFAHTLELPLLRHKRHRKAGELL
jgi:hypothetical protein